MIDNSQNEEWHIPNLNNINSKTFEILSTWPEPTSRWKFTNDIHNRITTEDKILKILSKDSGEFGSSQNFGKECLDDFFSNQMIPLKCWSSNSDFNYLPNWIESQEDEYFKQFNIIEINPFKYHEEINFNNEFEFNGIDKISDSNCSKLIPIEGMYTIIKYKCNLFLISKIDHEDPSESLSQVASTSKISTDELFTLNPLSVNKRKAKNSNCKISTKRESKWKPRKWASKPVSTAVKQFKRKRKHKTTEYSYLLGRKAIRMMKKYYSNSFKSFSKITKRKQNIKSMEKATIVKLVQNYIISEFKNYPELQDATWFENLEKSLSSLVFCNRYNKNEKATKGIDFMQVKNLLGKYNSKRLSEYFSNSANWFLYSHYFTISSKKDVKSQNDVNKEKLAKQMEMLFEVWNENQSRGS